MVEHVGVVASHSASKRSRELLTALLEVSELFLSWSVGAGGSATTHKTLQGCSCFMKGRSEAARELTGVTRGVVLLSGPQYKSEPQRPGFFAGTGARRLNPLGEMHHTPYSTAEATHRCQRVAHAGGAAVHPPCGLRGVVHQPDRREHARVRPTPATSMPGQVAAVAPPAAWGQSAAMAVGLCASRSVPRCGAGVGVRCRRRQRCRADETGSMRPRLSSGRMADEAEWGAAVPALCETASPGSRFAR